jgi:CBS domain-containing protein
MRFSRGVTWLAFAGVVTGGLVAVGSAGAQTANPNAVEAQANGKKAEKNAAGDIPVQSVSNRADRGVGVVSEGDIYDSVLNEDGSRTIRLGVAPKAVSEGKTGKRTKIVTDLVASADGYAAELAEPVRIGGSTDGADLVSVGKPGKQLRLGKPNSSGVDQDKAIRQSPLVA